MVVEAEVNTHSSSSSKQECGQVTLSIDSLCSISLSDGAQAVAGREDVVDHEVRVFFDLRRAVEEGHGFCDEVWRVAIGSWELVSKAYTDLRKTKTYCHTQSATRCQRRYQTQP
jgi:hypothetical protein